MHLATIRCNCAPAAALDVDYYVADFRLTPPPRIFNFFPNFKCLWGPPRLVRSSSSSGYILPWSPPVAYWVGFFIFFQSLLRNTLMYMDQWQPNACPHSSPLALADMVTTAGTSPKSFVAEDARILKAINVLLNMFPYMRCFLRRITTVGAAVSFRPPFNHRLNSCQGIRSNDYIRFELFWICQGCSSKCLRLNDRLDIWHILL